MTSIAKKTEVSQQTPNQYSRLQKLLSFGFLGKDAETAETGTTSDDYVDIILEADLSGSGEVKTIK